MSEQQPFEYRVSWQREGWRAKTHRFARLATATRYAGRLTTGDPHWRCDEGHGYYDSDGPDREWRDTCMPEIVVGPVVERRAIGPWEPLP